MASNKALIYKKIPTGLPVPGEHLAVEEYPVDVSSAQGGLAIQVLYSSFDPYLRAKMRDPTIKSYSPAFEFGKPMNSGAVAKVLKSDSEGFSEGDLVVGLFPISQYALVPAEALKQVRKINNPHDLDLSFFLGPLGMTGLTAWSGLHEIGKPKKGETIFVSSAAGAVGQIVGQIAKREGLTVIGSVGSDEKLKFITEELGFDSGFNYKKENPKEALPRLAPNGIDIYFENVGGEHLEAALASLNVGGRIPACGMISNYNTPAGEQMAIKGMMQIVPKQLTMRGFLVQQPEFGPAYFMEHQQSMQKWLHEGSVKAKMHVAEGIDNAAEAFIDLLEGRNFGKSVLKM